jgi:glucose-6-phosphate 1-dehydrogenase
LSQFRHVPGNVFTTKFGKSFDKNTNELVIRIQPEEAIYMKINNKAPGLGLNVQTTRLDLSYSEDLKVAQLPDAYERLLLDVVNGMLHILARSFCAEACAILLFKS